MNNFKPSDRAVEPVVIVVVVAAVVVVVQKPVGPHHVGVEAIFCQHNPSDSKLAFNGMVLGRTETELQTRKIVFKNTEMCSKHRLIEIELFHW